MGNLVAWGDESRSNQRLDPNVYILGAVLMPSDTVDEVRDNLRGIQKRRGEKLHWTREPAKRRDDIAEAIANCGITGIAFVKLTETGEREERMRRKCFIDLMLALWTEYDCNSLTLESRGAKQDRLDRNLLDSMRASHRIPFEFRLSHAPGLSEPLLWAADAVCGAVVSSRLGQGEWLATMNTRIKLVGVDDTQY